MSDKSKQNETLSASQEKALTALVEGSTVTGAAERAGVSRSTLYRWLSEDYQFQAELNARREELRNAYRDRLHQLADKAIGAVESAVENGDAKTALAILKELDLMKKPPIGSTDPEFLEAMAELEETRKAAQLANERTFAQLGA